MQIHELDPFVGELSEDTVIAIDDGTETMKIPANSIGITQEMTLAEAEAGTSTEPRVITPQVLNRYANSITPPLSIVVSYDTAFNALPLTITDSRITTNMVADKLVLSNPSAQTGDWTFNTDTAGQVTISGAISGSTQIQELLLVPTAQ